MKAGYQILLITFCAVTQCAGHASVSDPRAQQSATNSTPSASNRSVTDEHTALTAEPKNQKDATSWRQPTHRPPVASKIPLPSRASGVNANRQKVVHNNSQDLKSRSLVHYPQPISMNPIGSGKPAANRNLPIQLGAGSGIAGGSYRNRHVTQIPAVIGGPANKARNTAAINGSGMSRKRSN